MRAPQPRPRPAPATGQPAMKNANRLPAAVESLLLDRLGSPDRPPSAALAQELTDAVAGVLARRGAAGLGEELLAAVRALAARLDRVTLAVTGLGWVGGGVPAVERTLTDLIGSAQH